MVAKLLSLYFLVVASMALVQAGMFSSYRLIRPTQLSIDGIRGIAPLILDQRQEGGGTGSPGGYTGSDPNGDEGQSNGGVQNII